MIKQQRLQWIITIIAVGTILWTSTPITTALSAGSLTMGEVYPDFSEGILESAKLEKMEKSLLLKTNGFEVRDSFFKEIFGQVAPEIRKELEKNMLFLLDQEVMEKLITGDAKSMGIATEPPNEQMFQSYIDRVTKGATVSEKAAKIFYDENKEMVGGMPFDQVKEAIQGLLLQQEKQDTLQAHIQGLAKKGQMRINEDWVKKQIKLARDNPLDRARLSGKPTMVQFSSSGCSPCEMMKPIVKKLRKKYADTINVITIPVSKNQMLAKRFNVRAVPVQVFFDKKGKTVHHHMGFMAEADIISQFKKMGAI
ncbi:MAG: thioredoxin family protein [Deltaproteobacteria bacterium]|nr:thioredoxin family protein [Deltaproteobacteria bacterium]